jgi:cytochrome c oxidase assembly protein subunit 15
MRLKGTCAPGNAPGILSAMENLRDRLAVSPELLSRAAQVALASLALIVVTGAAVRLTGSGLGCPDWPKCYGKNLPPLDTHAVIEFGNRALSGLVGVITVAVAAMAFLRRPYRRDLALLGALLPLGVVAQAVLGGFTVREHLKPGFVMSHFALSMLILVAAVTLVWRTRPAEAGTHAVADRVSVLAVRGLLVLGGIVIFAGTAATASGPHAGGSPGQVIQRLTFDGRGTLDWTIHRHGDLAGLLGFCAVGVWLLLRRRGADARLRRSVTVFCVLLACLGVVGAVQYAAQLPAELVWVHVTLATGAWVSLLWTVALAGRLAPRSARLTAAAAPHA